MHNGKPLYYLLPTSRWVYDGKMYYGSINGLLHFLKDLSAVKL